MIIVGLIGMLASIAIPGVVRARNNSQTSVCQANLRQIQAAIQQCTMELKKGPSASVVKAEITPYMRKEPICPAGGTSFDDSYLLTDVSTNATCMKEPLTHILQ
jgi:type II secretory pathway pseudopilin PulG